MELISTHVCKQSDVGFHGNLFGGLMLAWLDEAAVAYVCQMCDTPRMVTVSIDKCEFRNFLTFITKSVYFPKSSPRTNYVNFKLF